MKQFIAGAALVALTVPAAAGAAETIRYGYDARGRLVKVERGGTAHGSASVTTDYRYDKADNRTAKTTSGSR